MFHKAVVCTDLSPESDCLVNCAGQLSILGVLDHQPVASEDAALAVKTVGDAYLAVGGNFGGPVGEDTVFPATTLFDYVRVYQAKPQVTSFKAAFTDNFTGWRKVFAASGVPFYVCPSAPPPPPRPCSATTPRPTRSSTACTPT